MIMHGSERSRQRNPRLPPVNIAAAIHTVMHPIVMGGYVRGVAS